jgi:NADPH-dependent 2,4-dienoyl-CoA reductase/sulfur reductase-like enzyme
MPIRCAVNATTGREIEFPKLKRDGRGQTVAVIGGGPAGMEAARVLAKRWFDVVLFEKEAMLGGTVRTAALGDYKDKLIPFLDGLTAELNALNVDVRLGQEATVRDVQKLSAVGVVIACGATPIIPNLPGVDLPHVATAEQVLLEQAHPEGSVAVIGSGLTGLEAAETLLGRGAKVTIIEMADEIAPGVFPAIRNDELSRILPHEPTLYTGHKLIAIEEGQVTLTRLSDGKTVKVPADGVVLALGVQPRSETVRAFQDSDAFDTVCVIGDANRGKRIADAIRQGYEAGYTFGMHEVK